MDNDALIKEISPLVTEILKILLTAVVAWVGAKVAKYTDTKTQEAALNKNQTLARIAVQAVEQKAPQSAGLNTSEEKKAAAMAAVQTHAPKVGPALAEDLVEAAVAETKTAKGEGGG